MGLINSTIERREMRLRSVERSLLTMERGLRIASKIEHEQTFRRVIAMLIGMPSAVAGLLLCGVFYAGWQGNGVWYGVLCLLVSTASIRPALNQIETHWMELQSQLFDLVVQRNRLEGELEALYKQRAGYRKVRNPIDVKGAA